MSCHSAPAKTARRARYRRKYKQELFERVIPFWQRHSPDRAHGGYLSIFDDPGAGDMIVNAPIIFSKDKQDIGQAKKRSKDRTDQPRYDDT